MITVLNRLQYCYKHNIAIKVYVKGNVFTGKILKIIDDELLAMDHYGQHVVMPIHKIDVVLNNNVQEESTKKDIQYTKYYEYSESFKDNPYGIHISFDNGATFENPKDYPNISFRVEVRFNDGTIRTLDFKTWNQLINSLKD